MLKRTGLFLTNKRQHGIWVALVCALLPFVGLPTFWISILLLALITLYKGAKEGTWVLLWLALPAIAWGCIGDPTLLIGIVVLRAIVVWWLATVLRRTLSWTLTLQCAALLGMIGVACWHVATADTANWWLAQLTNYWQNIAGPLHLPEEGQAKELLQFTAQFATGILAVTLLVMDLGLLLLARVWQAALFNPGALGKELLQVRMTSISSLVLLVVGLLACCGSTLALDMLPVTLLPFTLAGLSLIHAKLKHKLPGSRLPLLIGLYGLLVLFLPYMILLLALLGFVDSWYDFRYLRTRVSA